MVGPAFGVVFSPSGVDVSQGGVNGDTGRVLSDFSSSEISENLLEAEEVVDADSSRLTVRLGADRGEGDEVFGISPISIDLREARRLRGVKSVDMVLCDK